MNIDDTLKLIDALAKLLGVIIWPALLAYILVRFEPVLRDFFSELAEISVSPTGGIVAKRQAKAAVALAEAEAQRAAGSNEARTARTAYAEEAADVVAQTATPRIIRRARQADILWVDDRPDNNVQERRALEALGMTIVPSTSTEDALSKVRSRAFDVIVSDLGRPPDQQAGFTLLDKLREAGNRTPFIFYTDPRADNLRREAVRRGALGSTSSPSELFELVLSALAPRKS